MSKAVIHRGSWTPKVLFIGEAPGNQEREEGLPFVGPAGKILDDLVDQLPVKYPQDVAMVNLLKCFPVDNIRKDFIDACRPFLEEQLLLMKPRLVVLLGRHAYDAFFPKSREWKVGVVLSRASLDGNLMCFPMQHPAAALHDPSRWSTWYEQGALLFEAVERVVGYR